MTPRERLTRCYFHQPTDRPAVYTRTGFPGNDPTYDRLKAYLSAHTELKLGWSIRRLESEYPVERSVTAYSDDFERVTEILYTPRGELRRTHLESLKGQPGLHETYFINGPEEAERFLSLPAPQIGGDTSPFFAAVKKLGDQGIVEVALGLNPGGSVAELCGSTNFALLSVSDRDLIHQLCAQQMEIMLQRVRFAVALGLGPFFSMLGQEYIVPPLHGPKDFRDFNTKYDKPIIDCIHEAGGRVHVHSHGSIKRVFQGFLDMGVDVLHPFEPPPQGDILAREAKKLARGRMCLEGNIQIHRMYEASPEDVQQETERLIADAFDDHQGLIVCPTASPYIHGKGEECFPQFKAMIDAVLACR
ncbi:MAG: uroporphyrinogen decarboxylase family protein [Planctomycetota bacterium]